MNITHIISEIKTWDKKISEKIPMKAVLAICIIAVVIQHNSVNSKVSSLQREVSSMESEVASIKRNVSAVRSNLSSDKV
jgi:hypothetical protein